MSSNGICFLLNNDNNVQNVCSICLGVIGAYNKATTKCGHEFCFSCILKHLEDSNQCPLCRDIIEKKRPKHLQKITIEHTSRYIDEVLENYDISLVLYMIKNLTRNSYVNLTVHLRTVMTDLIRKLIVYQYKNTNEEHEEDEDDDEEDEEEEDVHEDEDST